MRTTATAPILLGAATGGPTYRVYVAGQHNDLPAGKVVHVHGSDVEALIAAGALALI